MWKQQHHRESQISADKDLLFNRVDGSTVVTVVPCNTSKTIYDYPRFTSARAGGYVMRTTQGCRSEQCSEKIPDQRYSPQLGLKPVSSDLDGVVDLKESLRPERRRYDIFLDGPRRPEVVHV